MSDFRIYKLTDEIEVWVGKNDNSNDLLTMKYTEDNDLWFHVRGASGAHTVLKVMDESVKLTKDIVSSAAAIAAYHSKARNAKNVTVAYTLGKYVNKFKGAKLGSVMIKNEKVVKVDPKLPE